MRYSTTAYRFSSLLLQESTLLTVYSEFCILFEVTSAYGTAGLGTGVPYDNYSLSGQFHSFSKVIVILVMIRGRHRGLPLAIDRSILLPGEKLMHKLDGSYNKNGGKETSKVKDEEEEIHKDEEESGETDEAAGKGPSEQDPERSKGGGAKEKRKKRDDQKDDEGDDSHGDDDQR